MQLGLRILEGKKPETKKDLSSQETLLEIAGWLFSGVHFYNHYRTPVIDSKIKILKDATNEVEQLSFRVDTVYHRFAIVMKQLAEKIGGSKELATISREIKKLKLPEKEEKILESNIDAIVNCDAEGKSAELFARFSAEFSEERADVGDVVLRSADIEEVKANLLTIAKKNKTGFQNSLESAVKVGDREFISDFFALGDEYIALIDLRKLLILAIESSQKEVVGVLVERNIKELAKLSGTAYTKLAHEHNEGDILKTLVSGGFEREESLLSEVVRDGTVEDVSNLLDAHENKEATQTPQELQQALISAIKSGKKEAVENLLKVGVSCTEKCFEEEKTPLMFAIDEGLTEIASILIPEYSKEDRNKVDKSVETALFKAVKKGEEQTVKDLLLDKDKKASLCIKCGENEETPLIFAIRKGNLSTAEILIENSSEEDLRTTDKANQTALYYAEKGKYKTIVEKIVGKWGDPVKADYENQKTTLTKAIVEKKFLEAEALIGKFDHEQVDIGNPGERALDYLLACGDKAEACMQKFYEEYHGDLSTDDMVLILFWFMKRDSDVSRKFAAETIFLEANKKENFLNVVQYLLEDATKGISEEETVEYLDWVARRGNTDVIRTWLNMLGISAIPQKKKLLNWLNFAIQQGNLDLTKYYLEKIRTDENQILENRDLTDLGEENIKNIRRSRRNWEKKKGENQWLFVEAHLNAIEKGEQELLDIVREYSGIQESKEGNKYVEELVWLIKRFSEGAEQAQPMITQILNEHPSAMNCLCNDGLTALMHANTLLKDGSLSNFLEYDGLDLYTLDFEGIPLLGHAVRGGKEKNIEVVFSYCQSDLERSLAIAKETEGVDSNIVNTFLNLVKEKTQGGEGMSVDSPLVHAAGAGNWGKVKELLKRHQDSLRLALILATTSTRIPKHILDLIEEELIQADFDVRDDYRTFLQWAVEAGSFRCVTSILSRLKVDDPAVHGVLKTSWESGDRAIFQCCLFHSNSQKLYQDYLMKGAERGDQELVRQIVGSRDPKVKDISKKIALFCAWEEGHKAIAKYLSTSLGGDFGNNSKRRTFVEYAALYQLFGMIDMTMRSLTNKGKRRDCVVYAARYGNEQLLKELEKLWSFSKESQTLSKGLETAILNQHLPIVEYFLELGAVPEDKWIEYALLLQDLDMAVMLADKSSYENLEAYLEVKKTQTEKATSKIKKDFDGLIMEEEKVKIERKGTLRLALMDFFKDDLGKKAKKNKG
ncbi:MAG: ankyrin repeat domain-containing protein [Candidatus Algichlamydia australiensis]|nr:ankyrin repeat domain-containing protein [Chlamydiales bacterium]